MISEGLRAGLARLLPGASLPDAPVVLSGGASQETWSLQVRVDGSVRRLVLRRAPPGARLRGRLSAGLAAEARLIELARAAGVPAPNVIGALEPGDGLGEGFLMDHVDGETLARRILRDDAYANARERLAFQCGEALARIHRIAPDAMPTLRRATPREELAAYRALHDEHGVPRPAFELGFQWLRRHLPDAAAPLALVHGDFRLGNLIVGPEGLRAVLDWELAHVGDPMLDLGWICVNTWRFGRHAMPVGGFGTREQLFAGYEAGGGRVDAQRVRFWEVLGTLKWGVMCEQMAAAWRRGGERTVERAAIGRRASEAEIDLLRLLAPAARPPRATPEAA